MRQHTAVFTLSLLGGVFALGLLALAWMVGPGASQAEDATMHNCPQPMKWAISVWGGDDGTDAGEAFATCGEGAVIAAYYLDPQTQGWSYWFAGQPGLSTLSKLDNTQGILALGSASAPATPIPVVTPVPTATMSPCFSLSGIVPDSCYVYMIWADVLDHQLGGLENARWLDCAAFYMNSNYTKDDLDAWIANPDWDMEGVLQEIQVACGLPDGSGLPS